MGSLPGVSFFPQGLCVETCTLLSIPSWPGRQPEMLSCPGPMSRGSSRNCTKKLSPQQLCSKNQLMSLSAFQDLSGLDSKSGLYNGGGGSHVKQRDKLLHGPLSRDCLSWLRLVKPQHCQRKMGNQGNCQGTQRGLILLTFTICCLSQKYSGLILHFWNLVVNHFI